MRTVFWVLCAAGAVASVFACVSDPVGGGDAGPMDSGKQPGTEGAPCLNGQCIDQLICASNLCVRPPDGSMMMQGDAGDGGMMMGGPDCGTPQTGTAIKCGAGSCNTPNEGCCMTNGACASADGGICSAGKLWSCVNKQQCSGKVCCYQGGGTTGSCPITTTGTPFASCVNSNTQCELAQYRMLCATNADCMGSTISTTCKPMQDPGGNIIGICSP